MLRVAREHVGTAVPGSISELLGQLSPFLELLQQRKRNYSGIGDWNRTAAADVEQTLRAEEEECEL